MLARTIIFVSMHLAIGLDNGPNISHKPCNLRNYYDIIYLLGPHSKEYQRTFGG